MRILFLIFFSLVGLSAHATLTPYEENLVTQEVQKNHVEILNYLTIDEDGVKPIQVAGVYAPWGFMGGVCGNMATSLWPLTASRMEFVLTS